MVIASRSNPDELHNVKYHPETNTVTCDCPGFRYHGYCSHIRFFKPTIKTIKKMKAGEDAKATI